MQRRELRTVGRRPATTAVAPSGVVPTAAEMAGWPVTVDVPTAGSAYGMSRNTAYEMARAGRFPVDVLRVGSRLRVRTAAILADLAISGEPTSRDVSA